MLRARGAGIVPSVCRRTHHFLASERMNIEQRHSWQPSRGRNRATHRVWDVMKLQIKENPGTELPKPPDCRRPLGSEQLYVYLIHTNKFDEAFRYGKCGLQ